MELGGDYYDRRNKTRVVSRLVKRLAGLGLQVTLNPSSPLEFEDAVPNDPPPVWLPEGGGCLRLDCATR